MHATDGMEGVYLWIGEATLLVKDDDEVDVDQKAESIVEGRSNCAALEMTR